MGVAPAEGVFPVGEGDCPKGFLRFFGLLLSSRVMLLYLFARDGVAHYGLFIGPGLSAESGARGGEDECDRVFGEEVVVFVDGRDERPQLGFVSGEGRVCDEGFDAVFDLLEQDLAELLHVSL